MKIATTILLVTIIAYGCALVYVIFKIVKENGGLPTFKHWPVLKTVKNGRRILMIVRVLGIMVSLEFLIIIVLLLFITSCQNSSQSISGSASKGNAHQVNCEKCDKEIISRLESNVDDAVGHEELVRLLCTFSSVCDFSELYPFQDYENVRFSESTFEEVGREILIIHWYFDYSDCMNIVSNHPEIDKEYILKMFESAGPEDLPFPQIMDSLMLDNNESKFRSNLIEVVGGNLKLP